MKALHTLMYDYSEPGYLYCQVENLGQAGKNRKNPLANPKKLEPGSPAMPGTRNKIGCLGALHPCKSGLWIHVAIPLRAQGAGIFRSLRVNSKTVNFMQRGGRRAGERDQSVLSRGQSLLRRETIPSRIPDTFLRQFDHFGRRRGLALGDGGDRVQRGAGRFSPSMRGLQWNDGELRTI